MHLLTQYVESNIAHLLPLKTAIIFEDETTPDEHHVGLFSSPPAEKDYGQSAICLSPSPLDHGSRQDADEHNEFIEIAVSVRSNSHHNMVELIVVKRSISRCIGRKINLFLDRCASHRYQLAVRQAMLDDEDATGAAQKLLTKLRKLLRRAPLCSKTSLKHELNNKTRSTPSCKILERHVQLRPFVLDIPAESLDDFLRS